MAREAARSAVKRVANKLATKWGRSYGEVLGWVQPRLSFAILWATNRCVRGSRVRWRSGYNFAIFTVFMCFCIVSFGLYSILALFPSPFSFFPYVIVLKKIIVHVHLFLHIGL